MLLVLDRFVKVRKGLFTKAWLNCCKRDCSICPVSSQPRSEGGERDSQIRPRSLSLVARERGPTARQDSLWMEIQGGNPTKSPRLSTREECLSTGFLRNPLSMWDSSPFGFGLMRSSSRFPIWFYIFISVRETASFVWSRPIDLYITFMGSYQDYARERQ